MTLVLNASAAADFNKNITTNLLLISNNTNNTPGHESKSNEEVIRIIKEELIKDKLIENGIYFEIKLTNNGLFINGIQQTAAPFKKYKALYENLVGKTLEKEISFPIFNTDEEIERQIDESKEMMRLEKRHLILKKELQRDRLIPNEKNLKVRLTTYNSGAFYINETKQPEKVFKKYKYLIEKLYATLEEGSLTIILD